MFKGRNKAIFFSIIVHVFIFYLISQTVVVQPLKNEIKPHAIKSFLYTPPIIKNKLVTAPNVNQIQAQVQTNENKPDKVSAPETTKQPIEAIADNENQPVPPNDKMIENTANNEKIAPPKQTSQAPKSFSAYGQLNNLKQQLNDKIISQESLQYGQRKTASTMDGEPELVPHSKKQLSVEEIKKKTSKQISSDIQITKGDDGRCTIERDLSVVGIEGVKSVEGFNCGKSKFDKSFQDHMKKVLKKLGK